MVAKRERGSSPDDKSRVKYSVNWKGIGTALLLVAIAAAAFSYPSQSQRVIDEAYDGVVGPFNYLEEVILGEEEAHGNSSDNPTDNTADNASTGGSKPAGQNESSQENTVTFRWTAYYELVEENNGNHPLENLIMEFPAPTVMGKERYQPIVDQIAIGSPGRWWIYENGELKYKSGDFGVAGVLSRPRRRGTRWVWSHGMSYSGYYDRTNGWKLLYSLFNKNVDFEVGMGFKARHVFQVPENFAGKVTIRDDPWSREKEYHMNISYDFSSETTGDEIFIDKWGVKLEKITENGPVAVEDHYTKTIWKPKYNWIEFTELENIELGNK